MKNLFLVLVLSCIANLGLAQMTNGTIVYDMITSSKDSTIGVEMDKNMFPGSKLQIDFMANKSRIQFILEEGFIITSIVDSENDKGLKTFQSEQGNYAIPSKAEEAKMSFDDSDDFELILTKEKKKILKYSCRKAIVKKNGIETVYWYTKDLDIDFSGQTILSTDLPGFPLSFTTMSDGVETTFIASKIVDRIKDASIFSTDVPEGYILKEGGF